MDRMRWWMPVLVVMAALWLVGALPGDCRAQGVTVDGWAWPDSAVHKVIEGIGPDSAVVAAAWAYDLECSGLSPQPFSGLAEARFYVVPTGSIVADGRPAYGVQFDDGRILLDSAYSNDFWLVAHELMHQLLRGPPDWQGGPHPWWPFAYPCELMTGQHKPGRGPS